MREKSLREKEKKWGLKPIKKREEKKKEIIPRGGKEGVGEAGSQKGEKICVRHQKKKRNRFPSKKKKKGGRKRKGKEWGQRCCISFGVKKKTLCPISWQGGERHNKTGPACSSCSTPRKRFPFQRGEKGKEKKKRGRQGGEGKRKLSSEKAHLLEEGKKNEQAEGAPPRGEKGGMSLSKKKEGKVRNEGKKRLDSKTMREKKKKRPNENLEEEKKKKKRREKRWLTPSGKGCQPCSRGKKKKKGKGKNKRQQPAKREGFSHY